MRDYYQQLSLPRTATGEQIRRAYREFAKHLHPDLHENDDFFTDRFREIQEAYDVLGDPRRRALYDEQLRQGRNVYSQTYTPPPPQASAAHLAELAELRIRVSELESQLTHDRWLVQWRKRTVWAYRQWRQGAQYIRKYALHIVGAIGVIGVCIAVYNSPRARFQWRSSDEVLASVRADLRAGLHEKVVVDASDYLSTRYSPLPFTRQARAALFIERARAKIQMGKDTGAIRDYTLALHFDEAAGDEAYPERGQIYLRRGQPGLALADFNALIRRNPHAVGAYRGRAMLFFVAARYDEALADYQWLCTLQPMIPGFRKMVGNCYWQLGQFGHACRSWQQAASEGSQSAADSVTRHCLEDH
jgi:tetratricopeptide (TPR) repeat protein